MRFLQSYITSFFGLSKPVWFLSLILFINRCGSMVLLFTSLYMTKELNFSLAEAGLVMSCYGPGSMTGSFLGGWLSDRYNVMHIMFLSLLCSGALLFLILIIKTPIALAALLFIYALTADVFRPANAVAIGATSQPENLTRSFSLVRLAVNLGFSIAPAIGGIFAAKFGYHLLFVIDASTSVIAAFVLIQFMQKPAVVKKEKQDVAKTFTSKSAYQDTSYLLFILFVALYGVCFFQIFASAPAFFSSVYHYSTETIGYLLGLNGLLVVVFEMPLVNYLQKQNTNSKYIVIGCICNAIAFLILYFNPGWIVFSLLYVLIITMSEMFAMPFMMTYATVRPHPERRGQYTALYSIAFAVANICAPLIGLTLSAKINFHNTYLIIVVLSILVAFGFKFVMKK